VAASGLNAKPSHISTETDQDGVQYKAHAFALPDGRPFTVKEYPHSWQMNVADLNPGEGGSRLYNAMAGLAKRTSKPFEADTDGFSDWSILRRTENMASNGLKYGTDTMTPSERQLLPGGKMGWAKGLEWTPGNDAKNQASLLNTSAENVRRLLPEIDNLKYSEANDRLENSDGSAVSADELEGLQKKAGQRIAEKGVAAHAGTTRPESNGTSGESGNRSGEIGSGIVGARQSLPYGGSSIARAVLTRSLVSARGAAQRGAILARLRSELPQSSVRSELLYRRGESAAGGMTPEQVKSELGKRLSGIEARKLS
jgi:hypothetical protein